MRRFNITRIQSQSRVCCDEPGEKGSDPEGGWIEHKLFGCKIEILTIKLIPVEIVENMENKI